MNSASYEYRNMSARRGAQFGAQLERLNNRTITAGLRKFSA